MCLAVPAKIIELHGDSATVDLDGIRKETSICLLDDVAVGDYVLLHVGFALQRIDPVEAAKTLKLFDELKVLNQTVLNQTDLNQTALNQKA